MDQNSYLHREPDFDGSVLFLDMEGKLINGWKYTDGKITATISPAATEEDDIPKTRGMEEVCYTDYVYDEWEECYEYVEIEYDIEWGQQWVVNLECETMYTWNRVTFCDWVWVDDEDDPIGGGVDPIDTTEPGQESLDALLPYIRGILIGTGINYQGITIKYSNVDCHSSAKVEFGQVFVCNKFFDYGLNDQASIIWHELDHIRNGETKTYNKVALDNSVILNPPSHIRAYMEVFFEAQRQREGWPSEMIDYMIGQELLITHVTPKEYYNAEIRCYNAEKQNGISISDEYEAEREFLLWRHQQCLNIIK